MEEKEVKDIVEDVVDVVEETYSENAKTASEDKKKTKINPRMFVCLDLFVYAVHVLGKVDIENSHFSLIFTVVTWKYC